MTKTKTYDSHHGVQKLCDCGRDRWSKCPHSWYLRYTPPGQKRLQIKIDDHEQKHIESRREAVSIAEEIKAAIRAGTFRASGRQPAVVSSPAPPTGLTVEQLGDLYFPEARNKRTGQPLKAGEQTKWTVLINTTITRPDHTTVRVGDLVADHVTRTEVEAFKSAYATPRAVTVVDARGKRYTAQRGGTVAVNRILGRWQAIFSWGIKTGRIERSPFVKEGVSVVARFGEQTRDRRLEEGELATLLAHTDDQRLKDLIEVAVDTGCRKGELQMLRQHQVRWDTNEIALPGSQTKNGKARRIPMLPRVREILERRRLDPDGQLYGPMLFVFGDVTGKRFRDFKTAWTTARLRAAGFTGVIRDPRKRCLTPEAKAALRELSNLKFHDLRREAGSSFLDDGMDIRAIQVVLDHANLATTNKYLRLPQQGLHREMQRIDEQRKQKRKQSA